MSLNKRKIGIIGAGHVGSHGGYALISQGLAEEEKTRFAQSCKTMDGNYQKALGL